MVTIPCPWCEADAPVDPALLDAAGGRFTCEACLVSVDLVEVAQERMPLAA